MGRNRHAPCQRAKRVMRYVMMVLALGCAMSGCGAPSAPPSQPHGVISTGPQITETIFALGEGHRVVAVSDFCDFPPEATSLPRIGGYMNPDFEKMTMLRPELIIVSGKHLQVTEFAEKSGIPYVNVYMDSLDTIAQGIRTIGDALGVPEKALALETRVRDELEEVRASVEGLPRPKVLIITGRQEHVLDSLATVGGGSFVSELIKLAGGDNLYEDATRPYFEASKETAVVKAPDAIVEFHAGENLTEEEKARYIDDWNLLPAIPAVKNRRVYVVTESHALRPGPRIPDVARKLAAMLHPADGAP